MSEPAAAVAATTGDPVVDRLTASFAALEEPTQVDNPSEPEKVEVIPDETVKTEEPEKEEAKTDEVETPEDAEEEGKEEDIPVAYPESVDELKANWPRAVPLKVIDQAYQWSVEAKEGKDAIASLGGEHWLPPLTQVVTALRDADDPHQPPEAFQPFFEGIVSGAGDTALLKVLGQSMYMGFVQAPAWESNPATKDFGKELSTKVDTALQMRFGVTAETIAGLADLHSIGAIDGLSKWTEEEFLDDDKEFDEYKFLEASKKLYNDIRGIQQNPKLKAQTLENRELKRQLEERTAEANKEAPSSNVEQSFSEYIDNVVDTVLPKVLFTLKSPLSEREGDTDEMKERKSDLRENITDKVRSALTGDRQNLLAGFKLGKQTTANYQTKLTEALNTAINKADPNRLRAERMIAELYGKTRNGKLLAKTESKEIEPEPTPLPPTQSTNFAPTDGPKTDKQILNNLEKAFAAHDANRLR